MKKTAISFTKKTTHSRKNSYLSRLWLVLLLVAGGWVTACGPQSEKEAAKTENNIPMNEEELMRKAIALSIENVANGGGPFGAVIAKDGRIVATGVNRVTANHDPTAHAEVSAIRAACEKLDTFDLSGCEIYTSCEPCPMCLGAIYWARLDKMYFANNKDDAKQIDFDDSFIYDELALPLSERKLPAEILLRDEALKAFQLWREKTDKIEY
jgi:tRNA(Arg) A34 adenosine deaminase TadA